METVKGPAEGRVLLRNVSWETYKRLIAEREERPVPRFFYDRGELEIASPSKRHETISRVIALLVEIVAEEKNLDVESAGSTTFRREGRARGFEPDECFYLSDNIGPVRGKDDLDLEAGDPPPDIVVEVDITGPSISKFPIYALPEVPEVWRHDGEKVEISTLGDSEEYVEVSESSLLPSVTSRVLTKFVADGLEMERPAWARKVREWARKSG